MLLLSTKRNADLPPEVITNADTHSTFRKFHNGIRSQLYIVIYSYISSTFSTPTHSRFVVRLWKKTVPYHAHCREDVPEVSFSDTYFTQFDSWSQKTMLRWLILRYSKTMDLSYIPRFCKTCNMWKSVPHTLPKWYYPYCSLKVFPSLRNPSGS